jgi:membrane protease YdiL (CAAX protease family)
MNLFMNKNENSIWISVLSLGLLALFQNNTYLELLIYWVVILLLTGNAKRVHSNRFPLFVTFIRRSVYIIPLLLPLFFNYNQLLVNVNYLWISVGLIIGILFIIPNLKMWKLVLSHDYLLLTAKRDKFIHLMAIYTLIGAAISEEIFFRYYILSLSSNTLQTILNIAISSVLFMLLHYGTKWSNKFSKSDFIVQLVFGFICAVLFVVSKSIIPSIIAHLVYNSPHVIVSIKSWIITKNEELSKVS